MTRTGRTLAVFLVLMSAHARAETRGLPDPHIRSTEAQLLDAVTTASALSPTFLALVEHLNHSDIVVYLKFDGSPAPGTAGHLSFVTAAGGRRYVRIAIDRRYMGCRRFAILGHELQHAVEIADAASVTDSAALASFYRQIGFRGASDREDCFDSVAAIAAGHQVEREARAASEPPASRAR